MVTTNRETVFGLVFNLKWSPDHDKASKWDLQSLCVNAAYLNLQTSKRNLISACQGVIKWAEYNISK